MQLVPLSEVSTLSTQIATNAVAKQRECCFAQYFEILDRKKLRMDNVDGKLGFIWLSWHLTKGEKDFLSSAREYRIIPVVARRGTVHTVCRNSATHVIDSSDKRCLEHFRVCEGTTGWENKLYYVNRFYVNHVEELDASDLIDACES